MRLTRVHRRSLYGAALALLWTVCALVLLASPRTTWSSLGPGLGRKTVSVGAPVYLVIVSEDVGLGGRRGAAYTQWRSWQPATLLASVTLVVALGVVLVMACRWLVDRSRLIGRCDHCGYDVRFTPADGCPECGAAIDREWYRRRARRAAHGGLTTRIARGGVTGWLAGAAVLTLAVWLAGQRSTTASIPGGTVTVDRTWGILPYLQERRVEMPGQPPSVTRTVRWPSLAGHLVVTAAIFTAALLGWRRTASRRAARARCGGCGCDLTGLTRPGCPICGGAEAS